MFYLKSIFSSMFSFLVFIIKHSTASCFVTTLSIERYDLLLWKYQFITDIQVRGERMISTLHQYVTWYNKKKVKSSKPKNSALDWDK